MTGEVMVATAHESGAPSAPPSEGERTAEEMRDIDAAVTAQFPAETEGKGNVILEPIIGEDGVKEWELTASVIQWETEPGTILEAYAYNGMVPGPQLRAEVDPLLKTTDLRIARTKVKVNGLEFIPQNNGTIAVFPQIGRIISSDAIVKFGNATVPIPRQVNLDVEGNGTIYSDPFRGGTRITVMSFKPNVPVASITMASAALAGSVSSMLATPPGKMR